MQSTMIVSTLFFAAYAGAAAAQQQQSCISVEVNGARTLPYACLSEQLLPLAMRSKGGEAPVLLSARNALRPSNELGVFNRSATAIRMGANFGYSAQAQRPLLLPAYVPLLPSH